jgi:SpoVK/Ycf46/Vps4 family AAA+-type ATPase
MNTSNYTEQFGVLNAAGAGVILTRTREPHRVVTALKEFAHVKNKMFRQWNFCDGWVSENEQAQVTKDGNTDPYSAMRAIMDLDGDGSQAWDNCIAVMVHPTVVIGNHPPLDECLRQYARSFPTSRRRLVVIAPEEYVLPPALQHDIPILDFSLPSREELRDVFAALSRSMGIESGDCSLAPKDVNLLCSLGGGMTESEFELACAKSIALKRSEWPDIDISHYVSVVSETKTEIVRRSEVLELMEAENPNNIGGLELLKEWINRRKGVFSDEAREAGVDVPRGIVLIGPPGTGKSMCAKAVAGELHQPLIKLDIGRCFGSLVGQTEGRVRAALKQVEAMAPCVVFLDEVDKAGIDPRQGGGDGGVSKRVMGSILTFMQESKAPMFWVLTANRPDSLPPELLRKGRMDEVFSVLPPNATERAEIIRIHLQKRKQPVPKGDSLKEIVAASRGYVGAEIEAAIKEACVDAFCNNRKVKAADIASHLSCMKPISVAFKADFDKMTAWADNNARPSSAKDKDDAPSRQIVRKGRIMD